MDTLSTLQGLGLTLPTPAYLVGALVFSLLGIWLYYRGKASGQRALKWIGVALMLYAYGVSQAWLLWVIGIVLTGAAYWVSKHPA
jgi:hypothetical protein